MATSVLGVLAWVLAALFGCSAPVIGQQSAQHTLGRKAVHTVRPSDSRVAYTGRWDFSDPDRPSCGWQGSSFRVRFVGTRLSAELDAGSLTEYFRIVVDGDHAGARKLAVGPARATYVLASGLSSGSHTVELVKETYLGRNSTLFGLEVVGAGLELPPDPPPRRIEFYGDSNLAGVSLEHEQNNGANQYVGSHFGLAGIAARMLDAEYTNVSESGATIAGLHNKFDRIDWWSPQPAWNFANFSPDLVVVNLGANNVGSPEPQIKAQYHAFLDDLRSVHPGAHIMLFNGWGWDYDEPANYIDQVIAQRGDPNMSWAVFPWLFEQWHGCEYDHAGMARTLADHVSSVLGWSPTEPDVMSGLGRSGDVANGGFEEVAPFGGFGWRYKDDPGVSRVNDPLEAHAGEHFVRLGSGGDIHQPNPADDGAVVTVTWWARGASVGDQMEVTVDFRNQQIYTPALQATVLPFTLTTGWQQFSMQATAPSGGADPVFHTRLTLRALGGSTVDVDSVEMTVR